MMNNQKNQKTVIITHIVNPHHFYFKYLHEIIANEKITKLDFDIQTYGNDLYSNQSFANGYTPTDKDDLVIFFNLIINKWIRGKVISIVGEQINLWCIDHGTFEKSTIQYILPLNSKFHVNLNLVHLGGLSLVPAEKTLNIHTTSIEMQPINKWKLEMISIFKTILKNAKMMSFTEEFYKSGHTFGLLEVESKNGTTFNVNDKFIEMNKSMRTDRLAEDISMFVCKLRLQEELCKSVDGDASTCVVNNNHSSSSSTVESKTTDHNDSTVTATNSFSQSKVNVSNWVNQSVYAESTYFEDSASMIVSNNASQPSTTNGLNESSSIDNRNGETEISTTPDDNLDLDYKCHFGTYSIITGDCKVRPPLPSTIDWINSNLKSNRRKISLENVVRENAASRDGSTIVNLNDNVNSTQSICSASSNESETIRNKKILALLAASKNSTVEKPTGLNGILQKFNSTVDDKIVNKSTTRMNAIPAGYQLSALHTFGDGSRR